MEKVVVTLAVGKQYQKIASITHPSIQEYADKIGAEFIAITECPDLPRWYKLPIIAEQLKKGKRVLFLDTDLIIRPDCPDLFELVPTDKLGAFPEGNYSPRGGYMQMALQVYSEFDSEKIDLTKYYNTGVMVVSPCHLKVFDIEIDEKEKENQFLGEQTWLNLQMQKLEIPMFDLPYRFNRMTMMDDLTGENRLASYIVHYAGCPSMEMMFPIIQQDLEDWKRAEKKEYKYRKNIVFQVGGGLGDQVGAEPVIRWAKENLYPEDNIIIISHYPRLFRHLDIPVLRYEEWTGAYPVLVLETLPSDNHLIWRLCPNTMMHHTDFVSTVTLHRQIPDISKQIRLDISAKGIAEVGDLLGLDYTQKFIVVHPGKNWESKTFPKEWWNEILNGIAGLGNVVVIGKHINDEQGYVDVDVPEGIIDLRDKLSIDGLIEVVRRAEIVISNDSAPIHIAGAFDPWIILIPTCKHPDWLLPYRMGDKNYKSISLYRKLTVDAIDSSPTRMEKQTLDYVIGDILDYLPLPETVIETIQKIKEV